MNTAIVHIDCATDSIPEVAEALAALPGVSEVYSVAGNVDLIAIVRVPHFDDIAEVMLPHIAGRPATRKRWPNGVDQDSFFEKQLASSAPGWLPRASVTHRSGTTTYPIIDSPTGLAWIAQQAALRVWSERAIRLALVVHPKSHLDLDEEAAYERLHPFRPIRRGARSP